MENSREKFAAAIRDADPANKAHFYELLNNAIELFDLPVYDVTRKFGVSVQTVDRWRNGKNAPHSLIRPAVYEWFQELTSMEIKL